ncbi:MAG: DNA recombination/repair protein RecA [Candidatus Dormibacteraeota bacterium]|nr:DNA recombination/repair protein RecA [Candidatus Dormibacteraeota bacterium]
MALSATSRETSLDFAVGLIQTRFGSAALQRASQPAPREVEPSRLPDAVPMGIEAIDALTGVGGLPNGRLSVCLGACGSGKTLLAYQFLASLSHQAAAVLWLDLTRQADPWLMNRMGAQLDRVLLLRPPAADDAPGPSLEAALSLVRAGVGGLIVDLSARAASSQAWDPMAANLAAACARSGIAFLALGEGVGDPLRYAASVVLRVERRGWVLSHGDVTGVKVGVRVEKNKVGLPGRCTEVQMDYPLGGFFVPHGEAMPA